MSSHFVCGGDLYMREKRRRESRAEVILLSIDCRIRDGRAGTMHLSHDSTVGLATADGSDHTFQASAAGQTLYARAESAAEAEAWVGAVRKVVASLKASHATSCHATPRRAASLTPALPSRPRSLGGARGRGAAALRAGGRQG